MDKGERAIRFIENLKQSKSPWAGKPIRLEPWQKDFIRRLFGTARADGLRQYRNGFLFIPRKNGKSTLAAGIALFCLVGDGEKGAEIYSAANDREQASLVFNEAAAMVRQDKYLLSILTVVPSQKRIIYTRNNSFYRAISADANTKDGFNASVVIYDEIHAAKTRELYDVLESSQGSREQPLMLVITTAGFQKMGIGKELYDYACKVRDGVIEDQSFLPVLYEALIDDDPFAESTWRKANPNYGVSLRPDYIAEKAKRAKEFPSTLNNFLTKHLNIWTESEVRWLDKEKWDTCGAIQFDRSTLKGKPCWAALDLASVSDLCSLTLLFRDADRWIPLQEFWLPKDQARHIEKKKNVPYTQWARDGFITLTDGDVVDYSFIRARVNELAGIYQIKEIAIDRLFQGMQTATELSQDGHKVVTFGQGFMSMAAPSKELERLIMGGKLLHGNNPVLNWMASNAVAEIDAAGNIKPSKAKSADKIDGITTLVMSLGRAMVQQEEPKAFGVFFV